MDSEARPTFAKPVARDIGFGNAQMPLRMVSTGRRKFLSCPLSHCYTSPTSLPVCLCTRLVGHLLAPVFNKNKIVC
jgi:hypothetical protein